MSDSGTGAKDQWLRVTLSSTSDAVVAVDNDGSVTFLNPVAESLTGWREDKAKGQPLQSVFHIINEESRQPIEDSVSKVLATGHTTGWSNNVVLIARDGTEHGIATSAVPIRDDEGRIVGCVLIFRDVSERKMFELALRESQERYKLVVAGAEVAIWDWDVIAKRVVFSPRWKELRGLSDEKVSDREDEWSSRIHPDDFERVMEAVRAHFEGRTPSFSEEYRVLHKDGRSIWILDRGIVMRDKTGNVVRMVGSEIDITERKQAEDELRRAEQFTRSVVDNVIDAIITIDETGKIESVNPATERIFGYKSSEIIGRNVRALMPEPYHHEHDGYIANYIRTGEAKIIGIGREVVGRRKDGSLFPMELAVSEFWMGDRRHFTGIVRDITERKRGEDALREADRRKNEFLATLAHELRNPLAPIRTGIELLKMAQGDAALIAEVRATMERQVTHMVHLIDDLMDVSRIASGKIVLKKQHIDLADIVRNAMDANRPLIEERQQKLTTSLPDEPLFLNVDPIRLAQAISNLLNNASKYSDRAGQIWLAAEKRGASVTISVRDSGVGIDAEQLPHVFEMFFQTMPSLKRSQGGLGIGLSLVKRLIEMHGGSIEADSDGLGRGSEFRIRLPADSTVAHHAEEPTSDDSVSSNTLQRRILVVDDNRDAANALAKLLALMGHETHTVHDGLEAVQAAKSLRPDIILLDIGLPNMNGYEVAQHLREQSWGKQLVLIAISGWGQDEDKHRAIEAGFDHHLTKPVEAKELETLLASSSR